MRKLFWLFLLTYSCVSQAQRVQSSCEAADSVRAAYENDAAFLSLKNGWMSGQQSSAFPETFLTDTILNALMAVYNAHELPERDQVVALYDIHAALRSQMQEFIVLLDPAFVDNVSQIIDSLGSRTTGNDLLDQAIDLYQLNLIDFQWAHDSLTLEARMQPNAIIDVDLVLEEIASFPGIVDIARTVIDGWEDSDITFTSTADYVELVYTYRWGNCNSGCQFDHHWTFRVYPDCDVELISVAGDPLAVTNLRHILSVALFPNPTPNTVSVNLIGPPQLGLQLQLYNAVGKLMSTSEMPVHNGLIRFDLSLSDLPIGIYFLSITNGDSVLTEKLVKR